MKSGVRVVQILCLLGMMAACKVSTEFPMEYRGEKIHFGQGGGFTGFVNSFYLLEDGRLFQENRDTTPTFVDRWNRQFTSQAFSNYQALGLDTIEMQEPGNLYYFIEFQHNSDTPHRITWGREGYPVPEALRTYYQVLYKSTKSKS